MFFSVGPDNLPDVLLYLEQRGMTAYWKKIGILLKLPYSGMEEIEGKYAEADDCIMAMFNQWLMSGTASKLVLLDALTRIT